MGACASPGAGTPALQPSLAKVVAPAAASQQKGERMVCISGVPTGSHIVQTNCRTMTAAQYAAFEKAKKGQAGKAQAALQQLETTSPNGKYCGGEIAC